MSEPRIDFHVVIPCAGSGNRMGVDGPKQYVSLAGKPLVVHTLEAFAQLPFMGESVLVVAPGDAQMHGILHQWPQPRFQVSPTGGATRAQSVLAGLAALERMGVAESAWVLVHDAARCLITPLLIDRLLQSCLQDEVGGLLALPLPDTLKSERQGRVDQTLDRSHKWLAQTPQMFRLGVLREALMMAGPQVTDEASAIEALGLSPRLVASASYNFKVTYPDDLRLAQGVLTGRLSDDWKQG